MENNEKEVLFSVSHLKKYFQVGNHATLKAVDDVSFEIYKGETLGMVGESGCGKTTCGRTCIGLYDKTDGQVLYKGTDVHALNGKERFAFKKQVQMVFQDPYGSLDPRMTVADIIGEGIDIHHLAKNKKERQEMIYKYLELVGLNREHANRFVHEFSGGQRQRIGIARSLAVQPEFIVLDEPISAQDVSILAQIVNLLVDLQKKMGLTYLFVAHDLSMVKHISDRVAVLYLGTLVELTTSEELYANPRHPYTQALLSAIPIPDPKVEAERDRKKIRLEGEVPSPINTKPGCKFQGRCKYAKDICRQQMPELKDVGNICRDLGKAFTIGLLSGGAAAAVLLLGGFLFGGFTFRAALEAAKDGLLLIAALGMFVIAGMLMVKGKNPEKFTQKEKWRVHFAVLGYKSVFAVLCVSWVLWAAAADYLLYRM